MLSGMCTRPGEQTNDVRYGHLRPIDTFDLGEEMNVAAGAYSETRILAAYCPLSRRKQSCV